MVSRDASVVPVTCADHNQVQGSVLDLRESLAAQLHGDVVDVRVGEREQSEQNDDYLHFGIFLLSMI